MTIYYATHNQQQGQGSAEATQGSRYQYLRGSFRRAPADVAGKGGVFGRCACRSNGTPDANPLRLGINEVFAPREISTVACGNTGGFGADSSAKRIISNILRKSAMPPIAKIRKSYKISPVISFAGVSESKTARSLFPQCLSQNTANKGGLSTFTTKEART